MVLQVKEDKNGIEQALDQKTPEHATKQRQKNKNKTEDWNLQVPRLQNSFAANQERTFWCNAKKHLSLQFN